MFRVAIQVKELISSNVTSALEAASDPANVLTKLQREIEESIITLEGERTKTERLQKRLEASITQNQLREADWSDKAKIAMDHGREDLARQALTAREDCRETIAQLKDDLAEKKSDLKAIASAIKELEIKREDTRNQAKAQASADAVANSNGCGGSKAEIQMQRINEMERRAGFACEDSESARASSAADREIDEMRRVSMIDAEIIAMRGTPNSKKTGRKKK